MPKYKFAIGDMVRGTGAAGQVPKHEVGEVIGFADNHYSGNILDSDFAKVKWDSGMHDQGWQMRFMELVIQAEVPVEDTRDYLEAIAGGVES